MTNATPHAPHRTLAAPDGFDNWLTAFRDQVEGRLTAALDHQLVDTPPRLARALRHTTLDGGKRFRPALVFLGSLIGRPWPETDESRFDSLWPAAIAVELVHVYSLVHDDLPSMDDDDLRRGRPTLHRAFDEATAILAGDALQSLAFTTLAEAQADTATRLDWTRRLAAAIGPAGMVGGQAIDLALAGQVGEDGAPDLARLADLHDRKTGALIRASLVMGARWAGLPERQLRLVDDFGRLLGRAFQIQDDILDVTGSAEDLGKTPGKDAATDKCSYVTVAGLDGARRELDDTVRHAHAVLWELATLGADGQALSACLDFVTRRRY
ncbi:farnesyl diphosphate synthase [Guyparkeria halophila]|uniref:Farnesyl diphosphate synthase n=1 Tax=Guyparkeria halophila TaxID=47960 RepID=A0ABZ0Z024_9GAMM|nr:farnesyl diphosphate synthase [Guyparkeria halophila]WQH16939.1 farnesyl diphosphate synthase [Guyparkeria halophila]